MLFRSAARLLIVLLLATLAVYAPAAQPAARAAATTLELTPIADTWTNAARPSTNYRTATTLRVRARRAEAYLRFDLSPWIGLRVEALELALGRVSGPVSALRLERTGDGWKEGKLTWSSTPRVEQQLSMAVAATGPSSRLSLTNLFPGGVVDRQIVSLRITSSSDEATAFGSRESAAKPRLLLTAGPREDTVGLPAIADARANSARPTKRVPLARWLFVGASPASEAYIKFDTSAWVGQRFDALTLRLQVRNGSAAGLAVYGVATGWAENRLNWNNRPQPGTLVAQTSSTPSGSLSIDLGAAYTDATIGESMLALRLASASGSMIDFSSREGAAAPVLVITPAGSASAPAPTPAPTPSPVATPSPTSAATAGPSVPQGLTGTALDGRYVQLSWQASTAGVEGTILYRLLRNGRWIGTQQPELTYTDRPASVGTHQYQVRAIDAAGNRSDWSAPISVQVVETTATPTPTPTPTASPTTAPTSAPSPTASPTSAPTPTPSPSPAELFQLTGRGTDHGAGMSQYGARGRAAAGQTFDQIVTHYYTDTSIDVVDGQTPIRVLLAANFKPTTAKPARVTGVSGSWTSALFPGSTFGPGTRAEMWPPAIVDTPPAPDGHWVVIVRDSSGTELDRTTAAELSMEPADATTILNISFKDWHANYTQFRGGMRLTVTGSGGLQAVNVVPVDQYLLGVVPSEVIPSWPIEAIKAQAVAARSFAWPKIGKPGGYDVTPSSGSNQVYRGVLAEHPRTSAAVAQTAGMILVYEGRVITAYYHTASGGYTENSEYVWPGTAGRPGRAIAYIRGRPDVDANGDAYDRSYGKFSFSSGAFTMGQLSQILGKSAKTNVGQIRSITFERGVSERVYRVTLVGSAATKKVNGAIFKNVYNRHRLSGPSVNSTMYWLVPYTP